jgi:hypothetical protein
MSFNAKMSIYIPRIFTNISKERIMDTFDKKLDIGKVSSVDLIPKEGKNGDYYNSAYIHFDFWYDNNHSRNIQEKIKSGKETRIVYDDPWYWIILENHAVKTPNRKLRIDLTGLKPEKPEKPERNDLESVKHELFPYEVYDFESQAVSESYDLVDAEYANQLEDLVADLRCQLAAMEAERDYKESLMRDELESLKNELSCYDSQDYPIY